MSNEANILRDMADMKRAENKRRSHFYPLYGILYIAGIYVNQLEIMFFILDDIFVHPLSRIWLQNTWKIFVV